MSYSRYKMMQKFVNDIPTGEFTQGDLIQAGPFNTFDECNEGNASPEVTPENPDMLYRWIVSSTPWCDGTDEYKTEKQQQSSDSGKSWSDSGATRKGEFVRSYSFTCGFVAERWIEVNPSVDFICENGNKFYLQKKEISTDGIHWNESGDKRKGPLIESQSSDCSYPQTRWVEIPIEIDYVCVGDSKYFKEKEQITQDGKVWQDTGRTRRGRGAEVHSTDCGYVPPTVITRWVTVEGEFICQGTDKHQKEKEQISNDSGKTWSDTGNVRAGSLIEKNSYSCGYVSFRWVDVPGEYVCQGYDKYAKQKEEKTTDGKTWAPTGRERTGALIEKNSYSCGYVSYRWVTVESEYVCQGYDKYTKEKEQSSTDGTQWQDTGRERAGSLIERDSSYCKEPPTPVQSDYLTFTALEDGRFKFSNYALQYSLDKVEWKYLDKNIQTPTIAAGSKIYFKGKFTPFSSSGIGTFSSTGNFTASGTPMSLLFGDDFEGKSDLSGKSYAFYDLFENCTKLTSIDGLSLPATTLANYCYRYMFMGCTGLTSIPTGFLPATTLTEHCYAGMFAGCTSLTSIPSDLLPATTLEYDCYWEMFWGCTSLTSIPSDLLPATTLAQYCYREMFRGCNGLTTIPSDLLPATTLATYCYNGMFEYCTNITSAPDLPATTLTRACYQYMFYNCTKLNSIRMLATDVSASQCLSEWVTNVSPTGTFYKAAGVTLPSGVSGIPSGWTVVEAITRWIEDPSAYICQNHNKYHQENEEITIDGTQWIPTGRTRAGALIETQSEDCGYVPPTPVQSDYLTFTALEDGTFRFTKEVLYYSTDGTTWKILAANTPTPTITAGSKIYFKGRMTPSTSGSYGIGKFSSTGRFTASGTPMSLLFGDDFEGQTSLSGKNYAFHSLFTNCTKLTSIDNLSLPATTLAGSCYSNMFQGCTGLTSIPSTLLQATILAADCYGHMFLDCTGLTEIPTGLLPATTLAQSCYDSMFAGCTGLTSIPTGLLPATTLAQSCYGSMFQDCTGLTEIPSDLLPATALKTSCYSAMFYSCTNITSAPVLPATTLESFCYYYMFRNCSKLNSIRMLATNISAYNCLYEWVAYVASSGTFYKAAGVTIPTGQSGIPRGWTVIEV